MISCPGQYLVAFEELKHKLPKSNLMFHAKGCLMSCPMAETDPGLGLLVKAAVAALLAN